MSEKVFLLPFLVSIAAACVLYHPDQVRDNDIRVTRDVTNCGPNDTAPPNRVNTSLQLRMVREEMASMDLDLLIVPLDSEGRLKWVSGFSGSNGQAVISRDEALLWTDGRYFIQAVDQLDCNWKMMRIGTDESLEDWVTGQGPDIRAGADPGLLGARDWISWAEQMAGAGVELAETEENIIDRVWTAENGRPPKSYKDVVVHNIEFAGESWRDKVDRVREALLEAGHGGMVVSELDEINWLLNIRGEGSSHNEGLYHSPTFETLALVTAQEILLWLHVDKVTPELREHLGSEVEIRDIESSLQDLTEWLAIHPELDSLLLSAPSTYLSGATFALYSSIPESMATLGDSPILDMKAIKNPVEVAGMVEAHIRDAVAVCDWAAFMESQVQDQGAANWTEISAMELLSEFRLEQANSRGDSFGTISAYGANGAIIHYAPVPETDARLGQESLYMVDSGGQYLEGTTDITRTFHYGLPTEDMVTRYTEVLAGAIDLASLVLPDKTQDSAVDLATRLPLFKKGLDYLHGTGHGIGAYGEVHEGPILVRMKNDKPGKFQTGVFFSDEPGYYQEGDWGLRLEQILMVVPAEFEDDTYGDFIRFEAVTLVPFEPKLVDFSLLRPEQIDWYNEYNSLIREKVGPRLLEQGRDKGYNWMIARTEYVSPVVSHVFKKYLS